MDIQKLSAPFAPDRISWRVGSTSKDKTKGLALAYIDARDVMERLDTVCGAANWQARYSHADKIVICELGIKVDGEWVWKANGAGETDVEGEKGAASDAFKRAAVLWGIGRYLYDIKSPWVLLEPAGNSYKIKDDQYAKLEALLGNNNPVTPPPAPKPQLTPKEWAKQQAEMLMTLDKEGIEKWKAAKAADLERLKAKDIDAYNELMDVAR